jgi:hypothetical protein
VRIFPTSPRALRSASIDRLATPNSKCTGAWNRSRDPASWLRALAPEGQGEIEAYQAAVPYPLAAARAKGRRFDEAARRRAGLSGEFIAFVRGARSSQEQSPGRSSRRNDD